MCVDSVDVELAHTSELTVFVFMCWLCCSRACSHLRVNCVIYVIDVVVVELAHTSTSIVTCVCDTVVVELAHTSVSLVY